jgi:hypothetical protein
MIDCRKLTLSFLNCLIEFSSSGKKEKVWSEMGMEIEKNLGQ